MIRAFARALVEQHGDLFKADVSLKSQVAGRLPFVRHAADDVHFICEACASAATWVLPRLAKLAR